MTEYAYPNEFNPGEEEALRAAFAGFAMHLLERQPERFGQAVFEAAVGRVALKGDTLEIAGAEDYGLKGWVLRFGRASLPTADDLAAAYERRTFFRRRDALRDAAALMEETQRNTWGEALAVRAAEPNDAALVEAFQGKLRAIGLDVDCALVEGRLISTFYVFRKDDAGASWSLDIASHPEDAPDDAGAAFRDWCEHWAHMFAQVKSDDGFAASGVIADVIEQRGREVVAARLTELGKGVE